MQVNESIVSVGLIEGWTADDRPQIKNIPMVPSQAGWRPHSSCLFETYRKTGQPACGNLHAGQGRQRVVASEASAQIVSDCSRHIDFREALEKILPSLGRRVLVSAGHFMPDKASRFLEVNENSLAALAEGLKCIRQLREQGIESDLIITINDVTIGDDSGGGDPANAATLSCKERAEFYQGFVLPANYVELIQEYGRRCRFDTFVVGENKLSERLTKSKGRLVAKGVLQPCEGGYALAFDASHLLEIAHDGSDTVPRSRVFRAVCREPANCDSSK